MTRECASCEQQLVTVPVPADLSTYASTPAVSYCQRCLTVEPAAPDDAVDEPSLTAIHPRLPTGTNAVGLVLLLGKLESLALNRGEIESLCGYLESNGVDLFLTLERLVDAPEVDAKIELRRRRTQLEEILS